MTAARVTFDEESGAVFVCGRTRRARCFQCDATGADRQCDGLDRPLEFGAPVRTCDRWLCPRCVVAGPGWTDLCLPCAERMGVRA